MRVIAGEKRHLQLKTLSGNDIRPTTDRIKETLFNMIQFYIKNATFLDLCAGTGAIGIEALSRGAKISYFVDISRKSIDVIKENVSFTKLESKSKIILDNAISFINCFEDNIIFDIIFFDPPYKDIELYENVFKSLRQSNMINENTLIIVEEDIETFINYEKFGFKVVKEKEYKTSKHIFLRMDL